MALPLPLARVGVGVKPFLPEPLSTVAAVSGRLLVWGAREGAEDGQESGGLGARRGSAGGVACARPACACCRRGGAF